MTLELQYWHLEYLQENQFRLLQIQSLNLFKICRCPERLLSILDAIHYALNNNRLAVIHDVQQKSLFSHLQITGSFRHIGQIIAPQPTHVLSSLLQAQWLHVLVFNFTSINLTHNIRFLTEFRILQKLN